MDTKLRMKGQNFLDSVECKERFEIILVNLDSKDLTVIPKFIPWEFVHCCIYLNSTKHQDEFMIPKGYHHTIENGTDVYKRVELPFQISIVNHKRLPSDWNLLRKNIRRQFPFIFLGKFGMDRYRFKVLPSLLGLKNAVTLPDCDSRRWNLLEAPMSDGKFTTSQKTFDMTCLVNSHVTYCDQRVIAENWMHIRVYLSEPVFPVDMGIRIPFEDVTIRHKLHPVAYEATNLCKNKPLLVFLRFIRDRARDGPTQPLYTDIVKRTYGPVLQISFQNELSRLEGTTLRLTMFGRLVLHMGKFIRRLMINK